MRGRGVTTEDRQGVLQALVSLAYSSRTGRLQNLALLDQDGGFAAALRSVSSLAALPAGRSSHPHARSP